MKKRLYTLTLVTAFLAVGFSMQSCVKDIVKAAFAGFDLEAAPVDFMIPVVSGTSSSFMSLDSTRVALNMDSAIRAQSSDQFGIDDADAIHIKSLRFELVDADLENNWSNFDTVNMLITSNTATTVAQMSTTSIPDVYTTSINGNVDQTLPMKDYLKGNTIYYLMYGTNRRPTTKELHGKIYATYEIR